MKKILFVTNKLVGGGSERVLTILANKLSHENDVTILSLHEGNQYTIENNVKLITYDSKNHKFKKIYKIRKTIKDIKPDVIISFEYFINMETCIANIGFRNRLIISERNNPKIKGNKHKYLRNFLYRFSDVLVCQTIDAKNYFPKYIQKKSVIILNPLKNDLPDPYYGKREKILVNFCRLEKQKNLKMLIDAFMLFNKKIPGYKLYIYGEGSEKQGLIDYIETNKLKDSVFIFPFDNDIHNKVRTYSMFVSSSDYEGLSNSMIEAMAIGLPTICTDCPCGGAKMIIKDRINGLLTDVGDAKMLSTKMIELIEDVELFKKISMNSIKIRNKLSIDNITNEWNKYI